MSEAKCETGWGGSLSISTAYELSDHPTPTLVSLASTLSLQGRAGTEFAEGLW